MKKTKRKKSLTEGGIVMAGKGGKDDKGKGKDKGKGDKKGKDKKDKKGKKDKKNKADYPSYWSDTLSENALKPSTLPS